MTQFHTLALDICIRGAKDSDDIWVRCIKLIPFVPVEGMSFELWHVAESEDTEEEEFTHKVTLTNVFYSFQHSMFIEEQEDDSLLEAARAGEPVIASRTELVNWYGMFGFKRISFPTVQVNGKS